MEVEYDNGNCVSTLNVPITSCPCSDITGTLKNGEGGGASTLDGTIDCVNNAPITVSIGSLTGGDDPYTYFVVQWSNDTNNYSSRASAGTICDYHVL